MDLHPLNTEYMTLEVIDGKMMKVTRKVIEHVKTEKFKNDPEPRLIEKTVVINTEDYVC